MKEPFPSAPLPSAAPSVTQSHLRPGDIFVAQGRFLQAEACYRLAIELQPESAAAQCNLGKLLKKQGRLREAAECYRRAIELQPQSAAYYYLLGNTLFAERPTEAEACYRRAIELQPDFALAYTNLGSLLSKQNRLSEEEFCYRSAIRISPQLAEAHNNLGKTLRKQLKLQESEACYRRAIRIKADLAETHYNLGEVLDEQGHAGQAEVYFLRAIELKGNFAEAYGRLAQLLLRRDAIGEAETAYRRAITLNPTFAAAIYGLANLLYRSGRLAEAAACYTRVIELNPNSAFSYSNLGNILGERGRGDEEELCYRRAIELKPDFAAAHSNLGNTLKRQRKIAEAKASYERAIELIPDFAEAHCNLGTLLQEHGRLAEAETCYRRALTIKPDFAVAHSNLLFSLSHNVECNSHELFAEHCKFGKHFEIPLKHSWIKHSNSRDPSRRLSIGLVSGDLRRHPVSTLTEPIIACLANDSSLALRAFANQVIDDSVSDRIRPYFQSWHRVSHLSDAALSELIRNEGIDILIDLSGHTANNRLLTFARKPAPIQASWIGYLGTTGISAMDYYLADRFLLPLETFQMQFVEKIIHLPATASYFQRGEAPKVKSLPALQNGYLTFGSFNRVSKLSPAVISLWAQLLRALPLSHMLIGNMRALADGAMVAEWFVREGIARDRLSIHLTCDPAAYMALFHRVDLCLDSFPYTGFTTTMDAMWMGVPTLTLAGCTPPGRQSAAVLSHVGLDDFVASDSSDFVAKGLRVADDYEALYRLRVTFHERIQRSILGQPEAVADGLKSALREMWIHWCRGPSPESI